MGFYGNITNTSKTQFTFDKRYPNRVAMDDRASSDGVYIGRYVLVEYDEDPSGELNIINVYRTEDKHFYTTRAATSATELKVGEGGISEGTIVCVPGQHGGQPSFNISQPDMVVNEYWVCTGVKDEKTNIAVFSLLAQSDTSNTSYHVNYMIDVQKYGQGRGYDSTVWQKVYVNSTETYVMVAELNTVVPTFDLQTDAPTQTPIIPHFDTDSNNVYYKLHWQPQWGMRIKSADNKLYTNQLNESGVSAGSLVPATSTDVDKKSYPSDESVLWSRSLYNNSNGVTTTEYYNYPDKQGESTLATGVWYDSSKADKDDLNKTPIAVYYNKAGFDESAISYSEDSDYEGWDHKKVSDEIKILPSGQSGMLYPNHDGTLEKSVQPDVQELSIMLPSIGDTIAKVWDLVYGDRKANEDYNEQLNSETGNLRNTSIEWQSAEGVIQKEGHRLVKRGENGRYTCNQDQVNTLAGAINSVHDLMGMIISGGKDSSGGETIVWETDEKALQTQIDGLNKDYIYYKDGKYYRKHKTYDFTEVDSTKSVATEVTLADWDSKTDKLYFKDSDKTEHPGYILDKKYYPQMTYVKNLTTKNNLVELGGEYKPNYYYQLESAKNTDFTKTFFKLRLCSDSEYDDNKKYYIIKSTTMLSYRPVYFYFANKYYYLNNQKKYVKDTNTVVTANRRYYLDEKGKTEVTFYTYKARKFYSQVEENKYIIRDESIASADTQYYARYVPYYPGKYYYATYSGTKLTLAEFKTGKYFKATAYSSDTGEVVDGVALTSSDTYNANTTYYKRDFVKDSGITHQASRHYYTVQTQVGKDDGSLGYYVEKVNYEKVALKESEYKPNAYYLKTGENTYVLDTDGYNSGEQYYVKKITYEQITQNDVIDIDSAEEVFIMDFPGYTTSSNLSTGYFYKETDPNQINGNNTMWVELNGSNVGSLDSNTIYYKLETETLKSIYAKNTYYYKYEVEGKEEGEDRNGSYLIASGSFNKNYTYYKNLSGTKVTTKFYYPNKYYYKTDSNEYVLATNEKYGLDNNGNKLNPVKYYLYEPLYVVSDENNIYNVGAKWNSAVTTIPDGVVLGTRTERWELQELKEFAYQLNTIHGLMLKLHEMLEMDDSLTRDNSSLMGALNALNDRMASFGNFTPKQPLVVDNYGRLNSATVNSAQAFSTTNWQTSIGKGNSKNSSANRFIKWSINGDVDNPSLTLAHNITTVADTTTTSNKNEDTTSETVGNNDGLGNTLKLLTPIIDNMGHVVGKNTETVTLPYGFKYVEVSNKTGTTTNLDISSMGDAKTAAADSTYATLYITGGNKWTRVLKDPKYNKVIDIGHYVGNIDTTDEKDIIDLNNSLGTLSLPSIQYDEAGHITASKNQEYSLPYTFGSLIVSNSENVELPNIKDNSKIDIAAAAFKDTLQVVADNKWVKLATDDAQTLYVGHNLSNLTAEKHTPNGEGHLKPSFGGEINIPIYETDEAGHVTEYSTETITLPKIMINTGDAVASNTSVVSSATFSDIDSSLIINNIELADIEISTIDLETTPVEAIVSADSLGACLAKLQNQITSLEEQVKALQAKIDSDTEPSE